MSKETKNLKRSLADWRKWRNRRRTIMLQRERELDAFEEANPGKVANAAPEYVGKIKRWMAAKDRYHQALANCMLARLRVERHAKALDA